MSTRAAPPAAALGVALAGLLGLVGAGCTAATTLHLSGPAETLWEVRTAEGARLCSLPCTVDLEEREAVVVAEPRRRTTFVVRQENLGEGSFSGLVRARRDGGAGGRALEVLTAALSGAGAALARSPDDDRASTGIVLTSLGAVAGALGDAAAGERHELWIQRFAEAGEAP